MPVNVDHIWPASQRGLMLRKMWRNPRPLAADGRPITRWNLRRGYASAWWKARRYGKSAPMTTCRTAQRYSVG